MNTTIEELEQLIKEYPKIVDKDLAYYLIKIPFIDAHGLVCSIANISNELTKKLDKDN